MSLRISGLKKTFGGVVALAGVDFDVTLDQILGIVGPNGSGKTTLINVVTGIFAPTARPRHMERCRHHRKTSIRNCPPRHRPQFSAGYELLGTYRRRKCPNRMGSQKPATPHEFDLDIS